MTPRFKIGTQYRPVGRKDYVCTVTDILSTYNSQGELVAITYEAEHLFCGQMVRDHNVCETTIARGEILTLGREQ